MDVAGLRALPSVERLVQHLAQSGLSVPRTLVVDAARAVVDDSRQRLLRGETVDVSLEGLARAAGAVARSRLDPSLVRAVNATGIILHTNLGRAPLSEPAAQAVGEVLAGYATLEIERETGRRGSRQHHVEPLLTYLTGAEAAAAVNNNAAAVLLALTALARGKQVVVSRGELVEIGGSFRLPEVMAQSGASLLEVGTTNRTYARDYERALTPQTGLLLKVHRSNFVQSGFVHEASPADLVEIGRRHAIPVMYDLGSGSLVDLRARGLPYEPTVQEAVSAGCDIVTFSGDKLLGGPQAGLIVGRRGAVEEIRAHPLARALRMDKLDHAALAATLRQYLDADEVWKGIPVLRMLGAAADRLHETAEWLRSALADVLSPAWTAAVEPTTAEVGGGSLPEAHLPSFAVALRGPGVSELEAALRAQHPPVFARVAEGALLFDVRTLLPGDDAVIVTAVAAVLESSRA